MGVTGLELDGSEDMLRRVRTTYDTQGVKVFERNRSTLLSVTALTRMNNDKHGHVCRVFSLLLVGAPLTRVRPAELRHIM